MFSVKYNAGLVLLMVEAGCLSSIRCRFDSVTQYKTLKGFDPVAQLVEHDTFNVGVTGSNPVGVT